MRYLEQALQDHELIVLRVIGEWWELDLTGADKPDCVSLLAERLSNLDIQDELAFLPPEEVAAMRDLVAQSGRIPVATFAREHGEVRQMGPGRLEREEPWYDPVSAAEALWYRGFIYRGFDDTADGVVEFFYIPAELLAQFPRAERADTPATPVEHALAAQEHPDGAVRPAETDAVDDLTTLLALAIQSGLRSGNVPDWPAVLLNDHADRRSLLLTLAQEMGLIRESDGELRPTRAAVDWLKESRDGQLYALADAWSNSQWNDLCHTPGLICEGERWRNDPLLARAMLLETLPRTTDWYAFDDLVSLIKENNPDFQRPDGNYDTWYIRDAAQGAYLSGFGAWELVEGRLLHFLLEGPLSWLGLVDTAVAGDDVLHFRLTPRALTWLQGNPPARDEVSVPLIVQSDGTIIVAHNADRYRRFQTARIARLEPVVRNKPFTYRLTPDSLGAADAQGITPDRVLRFLEEASGRAVPKSVQRAVERWSERGVEGRLETAVILRVRDAVILDTLRNNPKTRDFIGESLGDYAAIIKRDDWERFRAATAELGLLLDMA